MQIVVVEIPTNDAPAEGGHPEVRDVGDWASAPNAAAEQSPRPMRKSGVFRAVRAADELTSANEVWRWVPPSPTESPEGCLRLVVFQRGATWPPFLARDLSGGVTTCIVAEVLGDGLSGLTQRAVRRAEYVNLPVTQLIWISGESRRAAPVRFLQRLAESVSASSTVLVVQAPVPVSRRRAGRRRTEPVGPPAKVEPAGWPVSATGSG